MVERLLASWRDGDRDRFEPLFGDSPLTIHSIDRDGRLVRVSRYWLQKLGYSEQEVIGRKLTDFMTEESRRKAAHKVLPEFMRTGVCSDVEYCFLRKDGTKLDLSLSAIAEWDEDGNVARTFAVLFDITARRRAERALTAAKREAEQAGHAKTAFLAAVNRELRVPMTAIMGYAGLLATSELSPQQQRHLDSVRNSAELLASMLDRFLEIGQAEESRFSVRSMGFKLAPLIDEIANLWGARARAAGLSFELARGGNIPETLKSDPIRLRQVLTAFLSNAVKYTESGGIVFSVAQEQGANGEALLAFQVADSGRGIAEDRLAHIFDRFELDDADPALPTDSGVSLAICREFAGMLGGEVSARSKPGEGSSFRFSLPLPIETKRTFGAQRIQTG